MISPAEQKDLDELKAKVVELKLACFDWQVEISKMSEKEQITCGHRFGTAQAVYTILLDNRKKIANLDKAYLKKWPD